VESEILVAILIFFGGLLASGVLGALTWWSALLGVLFVIVLRPITGVLAMTGSKLPWQSRLAVGFLGIRGIGSIYYLSYGQMHGNFESLNKLWSATAFVILLSIFLHGVSSAAILRYLAARGLSTPPGEIRPVM
jgi:NhaP-type Na+/H+ or K+/H+ antiporter